MPDIMSMGDADEDIFLELEEANVHCDKGPKMCMVCFHYADKVPVRSINYFAGGNAANNAVGLSRFGIRAALYCELGDDEAGNKIYNTLRKEGVSLKYVFKRKKAKTNRSVVLNYQFERTIFVYHEKRNYKLPKLEKCKWLYYTSMGDGFERMLPELEKYIKKNNIKVVFNPGTYQLKSSFKILRRIMKFSSIIILNKEEAQLLAKANSGDFKALLRKLHSFGPEIAVITDGPNGSFSFDGKDFYFQKIFRTRVVDRTGCGDAFASGFLAALFYGHDFREAMRWGAVNSASVLGKAGPQEGLLGLNGMKRILGKNKKLRAVKF